MQAIRDGILRRVDGVAALTEALPHLIRDSLDFVIDPVRTARTRVADLDNVEKTFIGLKVEHYLRDLLDVPKGLRDLTIDGIDVDVKNTVGTTWSPSSAPPEVTPLGVIASRAMQESTFTLPSDDGVALHVYRWSPDPDVAPRAVLQVSHGLAEHAGRYRRLAEHATARGLVVYADDHRGHGRTARTDAELGVFARENGWRKLIDDLGRVTERALSEHPGLPVVFFGHSMGSFTAQQVAFERGGDFAGVILSASISGRSNPLAPIGRVVARVERLRIGAAAPSALLDMMSFGSFNRAFKPARTAFDWLSRDAAEVDAYIADPRCGFKLSAQGWIDLLDGLKSLADPANQARIPKELPVYLIAGEADPVVGGLKFFQRLVKEYNDAGLRRFTWKVYPGARHELLNETNRDEVTRDLLDWIDAVALAPGA